ncbi:MAG: WD40/YVTN/BNR-like repeat-containing protein [Gemmatimonadota bacterium]
MSRPLALALTLSAAFELAAQQATPVRQAAARTRAPAPPALVLSADPVPATAFAGLSYRNVGPARGGRVTTVTGVLQQPLTFYMGPTGGGVWKTVNAGHTWINVSDRFFNVASMGDIDVADSDPNIIYAGTGSDGYRSNVAIGRGVYKSNDAGATWQHVGLPAAGNIGAVRIHPTNPDIAFVAAIGNPFRPNPERGVYRTTNGGRSWDRVLFVSDSTGAVDIELQPGNPNVIYASMWRAERKPWTIISGAREGGVYKSTDGGSTWKKLASGLPGELFGKSNLAVTPAAPNGVWVIIEAKPGSGLYRSDDAGESWRLVSNFAPMLTRPFYYTGVTVHPRDPNTIWTYSEGYYKSTDGGRTWRSQSTPHGDNHDLWINPNAPDIMVQSNDGGANVSIDGGRTWSTQYNQPTAEIYQVEVDDQFPYRLYGAQQDNSTLIVPSLPLSAGAPDSPMQEWRSGPGCETGPIMPHRTNPDTVYGACKGQFSRMSLRTGNEQPYWNGGQSLYGNPGKDLDLRFQRVAPMEVSRHEPNTVYYGSQYVHRTRDGGVTWQTISPDLTLNPPERQQTPSGEPITLDGTGEEFFSTLYAIKESRHEPGVIWTGSNDGPFHITRDGGRTWRNITPRDLPATPHHTRNNFRGPPDGCRTQNLEPSPHRRGSAYYAVHCYLLGDFRPYIWRTDDYGATWSLLTTGNNGIPADEPVRVVREDPEREGLLYTGTEFGMYVSFNNGRTWQPFQLNLPSVPITDMRVHQGDLVLSTQGRSFWILGNLNVVRQASDRVLASPLHVYVPRVAYRHRYSGSFGGVESDRFDPADPQYPPAGAQIDYWLGSANVPVTLEILDAAGSVVRSFSSDAAGESTRTEPSMRRMVTVREGTPRLPNAQGHNRFTWDLRLPGPWDANPARSGRNGPVALPGTYAVRVTAGGGGTTATQRLSVQMDPRISRDGVTAVELREQLRHNLQVRDMVSEVNHLALEIEEGRRRLASAASAADTLKMLEELRARIVTPAVRYSKPELQSHITYLYSMTMQADQKIGRDAITRYAVLRKELDDRIAEAKRLLGGRVAM